MVRRVTRSTAVWMLAYIPNTQGKCSVRFILQDSEGSEKTLTPLSYRRRRLSRPQSLEYILEFSLWRFYDLFL